MTFLLKFSQNIKLISSESQPFDHQIYLTTFHKLKLATRAVFATHI